MQKTLAQSLGQENSPGGGNTLVFLPAKFHIQRSPAGYSPWGCKESDMTGHALAWPKKKKKSGGQMCSNMGGPRDYYTK